MDKNGDGLVTKQVGFSSHALSDPVFRILFRILFWIRIDLILQNHIRIYIGNMDPDLGPEAMKRA
jgi:hypothetical protein